MTSYCFSIEESVLICNSHCLSRAENIMKDSTHAGYDLFEMLPSATFYFQENVL